jgi:excinuclease ABC subunit B
VLIVASVSCIYGARRKRNGMMLFLEKGQKISCQDITRKLVDILYERTDGDFRRDISRTRRRDLIYHLRRYGLPGRVVGR